MIGPEASSHSGQTSRHTDAPKERVTVRFTEQQVELIDRAAMSRQMSHAELVADVVSEFLLAQRRANSSQNSR